jgi:TolB-like protein/AraC-like DNA-binding protein
MTGASNNGTEFIEKLKIIVESNLHNEQFGVSELTREAGMSRSAIHRRLKSLKNQSISQFIRTIRLEKAKEMLLNNQESASEIAFKVGFGSPAYFNHCFHEYYGIPPGEVRKRGLQSIGIPEPAESALKKTFAPGNFLRHKYILLISSAAVFPLIVVLFIVLSNTFKNKDHEKSLIVLPFVNLTTETDNQYFADGLTEDILNSLFHITALKVVSRTSAERFRESNLTVSEIAKLMNVNYVLEGSVRKFGNKTRITAQLIDAKNDNHLWSESYDQESTDVIKVQGNIALQVAQSLDAVLSDSEVRKIEKISTKSMEAYDHYLRARFLLHKANSAHRADFEKEGVQRCIQYYEQAIKEDTMFAEAYSGLANAWFNLTAWGILGNKQGFIKSREYSLKALQIDPDCAEAHAVLGAFLIWGARKIDEGSSELKTSVELNPNFSTARQWYSQALMITGPVEEARMHINRALELEPYFWVVQTLSGWIYYFEKEYNKAINECLAARDLNPDFIDNNWLFVLNYSKLGEGEKMLHELQSIVEKYSGNEHLVNEVQDAFALEGIDGIFKWLIEVNKSKPVPVEGMNGHPYYVAWWNALIGNADESVYWFERTLESDRIPYHYFNLIATNPDFDFLGTDNRFIEVIEKAGLAAYHNPSRQLILTQHN